MAQARLLSSLGVKKDTVISVVNKCGLKQGQTYKVAGFPREGHIQVQKNEPGDDSMIPFSLPIVYFIEA